VTLGDGALRRTRDGVAYRASGQGRPVVLVHGWCLDGTTWLYQEEALAGEAHVVVPDLPGFGASAGLGGPFTLGRYATDLGALLEELALEDAVVVGFAFGALVALAAAAAAPEPRVGGVVAIGVPSASTAPYERMPRAMRRDWPEFARRSARAIVRHPPSDATVDWLAQTYARTRLPVALAVLDILAATEPADLVAGLAVPTLFIHGAEDDIVPVDVARACAGRMAHASLAVVEDSGHLVPLDQPGRVTELVREFVAGRATEVRP
jgi:pimeloyl-ACP methyl ester carboxylesterase